MIKVTIKKYNNKSRKGTYAYIKEPKQKARIIKHIPGTPLDYYTYAYQNNIEWRQIREGQKEWKKTMSKKGKSLTEQLQKGITQTNTTLNEIRTPQGRYNVYKRLLGPLVKDKGILELVIKNAEKLKNRFSYEIDAQGTEKNNQKLHSLITTQDIGRLGLEQLYTLYGTKAKLRPGMNINTGTKTRLQNILKLNEKAIRMKTASTGIVKKVRIKVKLTN